MALWPFSLPSGIHLLPPTVVDQFCPFLVLYILLLAHIGLLLPRSWFISLFRIAFPFMPKGLEDLDRRYRHHGRLDHFGK